VRFCGLRDAKTAAKSILASAVNHFTFSVAGAIFDAPAAISTSTHIKRLGDIQLDVITYPCKCAKEASKCGEILTYIIAQKEKKKARRVLGAIPVIGTFESVRGVYKSLTKTNKGSERELMAKILRTNEGRWNIDRARSAKRSLLRFVHRRIITDIPAVPVVAHDRLRK
jgi:hypothetical protein